jgi:type I restriction enzyme S subunit
VSRLGDLVREACPSGVPLRPLGDLLDHEQPGKYLVASKNYNPAYATPVLTAGQSFLLGHTNETEGVYPASPGSPVVIFDDFTTASKWVDFPFKAKSSAMKMLTTRDGDPVTLRFVFHAMQTLPYEPQEHARQWIATYSQFRVPWPPEAVRREIVRALDTFESLGVSLEAELAQRRIQLAHYREQLMRFRDVSDVEWRPMGKIGDIFRGKRFTKADYVVDGGIGCVHYGEIYTEYGTTASATISRIRASLAPKMRFATKGDVVLTDVGETVEDVGKAVAWMGAEDVAIHDHCYVFRSHLNPVFVSYYMQTAKFRTAKDRHIARTKVNTLLPGGLPKILMPVPSAEDQERIVTILDALNALISDTKGGLPTEIAARRRQFEHYRDRLLAFDEAIA